MEEARRTLALLSEHGDPPFWVRATVPAKPFAVDTVTIALPEEPVVTVSAVGLTDNA